MSQTALVSLRNQLNAPAMLQALRDAVPTTAAKYLTPERIVRIVTLAASKNPRLLSCDPKTVLSSVVDCVQLGLEPGGPLGHAYLVPYGQACVAVIGYQGYLSLARRSGEIESIFTQVVYSGDKFRVLYGCDPTVEHEPKLLGDRGDPVAVYCVAKFRGGGRHIEVMTVDEVEAIRKRSKAGTNGPWITDWGQMARKTIIRRARHYWPISVEMAQAAELDDRVDVGAFAPMGDQVVEASQTQALPEKSTKKLLAKIKPEAREEQVAEVAPEHDYGPPAMTDEQIAEYEKTGTEG